MSKSLRSMDCSLLDSSACEILQARILEWLAVHFSRRSFWFRDWTQVSCIVSRFFMVWATREGQIIYTNHLLWQVHFQMLRNKQWVEKRSYWPLSLRIWKTKRNKQIMANKWFNSVQFSSVQSLSCVLLFATP